MFYLTYEIFRVLAKSKEMMTASQVAEALGIERVSDVGMVLLRLKRYGQVRREREEVGTVTLWEGRTRRNFMYFYEITGKGRSRLGCFKKRRQTDA